MNPSYTTPSAEGRFVYFCGNESYRLWVYRICRCFLWRTRISVSDTESRADETQSFTQKKKRKKVLYNFKNKNEMKTNIYTLTNFSVANCLTSNL